MKAKEKMTAYFCYERDFANRPKPVVYFDKPQTKGVNGTGPERSQIWNVPPEMLGADGVSPEFGKLMERFPL